MRITSEMPQKTQGAVKRFTPGRLKALANFVGPLSDPTASFGTLGNIENVDGVMELVEPRLSALGSEFVEMAYKYGWVRSGFDWVTWKETPEARALADDPAALAHANVDQLSMLLTTIIREDRFVSGALISYYSSGLILRIAERAEVLRQARAS
jgi:hypothetical protein